MVITKMMIEGFKIERSVTGDKAWLFNNRTLNKNVSPEGAAPSETQTFSSSSDALVCSDVAEEKNR